VARKNGHKQEQALIIGQPLSVFRYDPGIQHLDTAEVGVKQVLAYGITALLQDESCADLIGLLPEPNGQEQPWEYADRAHTHLLGALDEKDRRKIRAAIIDLGMDRADTARHLLSVGRRILAWRVYTGDTLGGSWIDSPSGAMSFDEWLMNVSRNASKTERSRIRTVCKALAWLIDNGRADKLPEGPEEVFLPGNWRRWSAALAAVWRRKLTLDEGNESIRDILEAEIDDLLERAGDETITVADFEEYIKQNGEPQLPPVIIEEDPQDPDTGLYQGTITYGPAQRSALVKDQRFDVRLRGETYGVSNPRIVQYRKVSQYVCRNCGAATAQNSDHCLACGAFDMLVRWDAWSEREWSGSEWSEWRHLEEEPERDGHLISRLADADLGVEYWQYVDNGPHGDLEEEEEKDGTD